MAILEHNCTCGFHSSDNERLLVCPQCSSNQISNESDEERDFDEAEEALDDDA